MNPIAASLGHRTLHRSDIRLLRGFRALVAMTCAVAGLCPGAGQAAGNLVRIKDICDVEGVRANQIQGLGLVVGLNATGGQNPNTRQVAQNMLQNLGQRASPTERNIIRDDTKFRTDNMSLVIVTAELPPYARPGSRIDVVVSTVDDATSLQGGTLITTPLRGADDQIYAVAHGEVSTGGFSFSGQAASVQKNHPTVGRISNGGFVERRVCIEEWGRVGAGGVVNLLLRDPNFETARRIAEAINLNLPQSASIADAGTVSVIIPPERRSDVFGFVARLGGLMVTPDVKARVVINERTGTVVVGSHVKLSQVAITHANLAIVTGESPQVSQPLPFSAGGQTAIVPRTELDVVEEQRRVNVIDDTTTVGDIAQALNALGVTPRDLSSIFQQLKASGSLHAELIIQ